MSTTLLETLENLVSATNDGGDCCICKGRYNQHHPECPVVYAKEFIVKMRKNLERNMS